MKVLPTKLKGCVIIEPEIHEDDRGYFVEVFQANRYAGLAEINLQFVQDNHSYSHFNVLRGLHFQKKNPQGRLIRAVFGEVYDVAVDVRALSDTFGEWEATVLSESNKKQLWLPPGFAHGFQVLSKSACIEYKCTEYYDPKDEGRILWCDPDLSIPWPNNDPILSNKDASAPLLADQHP